MRADTIVVTEDTNRGTVGGLRAGTDYYFRVLAENGAGASQPPTLDRSFVPRTSYDKPRTSRSARRDAIQSDALLARPDVVGDGAVIMAHVIERPEHLSPTWSRVARVQPQTTVNTVGGLAGRTVCHLRVGAENVEGTGPPLTLAAVAQSLCTMPAVTCFVSAKDNFANQMPVTFTSIRFCRHVCNMNKNTYIWTVCHFS